MSKRSEVNVLLIEDVEDDMIIIEDHLSQAEYTKFNMTWVVEKEEATSQILGGGYDVILLDHDMVGYTGMDVLKEMRDAGCHNAMIFLSGSKDPLIRSEALKEGASGFLIKGDISPAMLELSILFAIEKAEHLSSLELMVDERTSELNKTIEAMRAVMDELKGAQSQLVEQETLANLGGLVASIAHEINTPVGVGVTAASHLQDKTSEIVCYLNHGGITRQQLDEYLDVANESSELILGNLERAAELIRSFKRMAVDQQGHHRREFSMLACINDVVSSLTPKFKHSNHHIDVQCSSDLVLDSYPGIYSQIFTNLINNSLIHAFGDEEVTGNIKIKVETEGSTLNIFYSDDGKGMDAETLKNLFMPFFTTRRNQGGSGLGATLIMNCVKQLEGKVKVDSQPGQGVNYLFTFPLHLPEANVESPMDKVVGG